jgi:hypothetical protein
MQNKEDLVRHLLKQRFPAADAMYDVYKRTGALEMPHTLTEPRPKRASKEELEARRARYEEIRRHEDWLLAQSYEDLEKEQAKENTIEVLCKMLVRPYSDVKPETIAAKSAMSVPTPGADPSKFYRGPSFNGKLIGHEEQKEILQKVEELKADFRSKSIEELTELLNEERAKEWRSDKLLLDDAARLIAGKIHLGDEYPWIKEDRAECEQAYRKHLKSAVLSGLLPFHNPHNKTQFDYKRLSEERFPHDGLLSLGSLYLGLMDEHKGKGYLPTPPKPPKPVSKAPPPITPIETGWPDLRDRFVFKAPDWDKWRLIDRTELWKAACLLVEIEPPREEDGEYLWQEYRLKTFPDRFHRLWEVINSDAHISRKAYVNDSGRMLHDVDIGWLAVWALEKGLTVPEPMQERAKQFRLGQQQAAAAIDKAKLVQPEAAKPLQPEQPATEQDAGLNSSGDALPRMVEWRRSIVHHWPGIVQKYGDEPQVREAIAYLKAHDADGCILPGGKRDEIRWVTASGEEKTAKYKTVANAITELKKEGLI